MSLCEISKDCVDILQSILDHHTINKSNMRRKIDAVIQDLRDRADYLNSKIVYAHPSVCTDGQLMREAADRLQAIEILEKELEESRKEISSIHSRLKLKKIILE